MPRRWGKGGRDANEPEIVEALRKVGAQVIRLAPMEMADLLVGYNRRNFVLEVKNPARGKSAHQHAPTKTERAPGGAYEGCLTSMSRKQFDEIKTWKGAPVAVIETTTEALLAIGMCSRCWEHPVHGLIEEMGRELCVDCEMTAARGY